MKLLRLILVLSTLSLVVPLMDKSLILDKLLDKPKELFKSYYVLFNKDQEYNINSEEGLRKFLVFKDNLIKIKEENKRRGEIAYGITPFTDLTAEEYSDRYFIKQNFIENQTKENLSSQYQEDKDNYSNLKLENIVFPEIDYRNKMGPIKNLVIAKPNVKPLWFSLALAAVEGNYNVKFGTLYDLSAQFLFDCDEVNNNVSDIGFPERSLQFMKYFGVQTTSDRPYRGKKVKCTSDLSKNLNIVDEIEKCADRECKVEEWIQSIQKGPVIVYLDGSNFQNYKPSSIDIPVTLSCRYKTTYAIAVGIKNINGKPHIIGSPMTSADWGYNGYFSMLADPKCLIMSEALRPAVKTHSEFEYKKGKGALIQSNCNDLTDALEIFEGEPDFMMKTGRIIQGITVSSFVNGFILFSYPSCKGQGEVAYYNTPNITCVPEAEDLKMKEYTSIAVTKPDEYRCIYLYEKQCNAGKYVKICKGLEDIAKEGIDLSFVNTIQIGGYFDNSSCKIETIVLHADINFNGEGKSLSINNSVFGYIDLEEYPEVKEFMGRAKSISFRRKRGSYCELI